MADQPQPGQIVLNTETVIETLNTMLSEKDQQIVILRSQLVEAQRANARMSAELATYTAMIVPSDDPEG